MYRLLPLFCVPCLACSPEAEQSDSVVVDEASSDPCEPNDTPTLEVGHGELGFISLGEGTEQSELIHGPQGGYHTNIALSATGMDASHHWTVELGGWIGNNLVGHTFPIAKMRCNRADEALQAWSLLLIWDAYPEELHGKTADIEATIWDNADIVMTAEQSLIIWDPTLE